jgi:hypothetical protein
MVTCVCVFLSVGGTQFAAVSTVTVRTLMFRAPIQYYFKFSDITHTSSWNRHFSEFCIFSVYHVSLINYLYVCYEDALLKHEAVQVLFFLKRFHSRGVMSLDQSHCVHTCRWQRYMWLTFQRMLEASCGSVTCGTISSPICMTISRSSRRTWLWIESLPR